MERIERLTIDQIIERFQLSEQEIKKLKEMTENKYYTPSMEELHIGFEFEYVGQDGGWDKCVFGEEKISHSELDQFNDDLHKVAHAITRVKYLDKQDIEECGWKNVWNDSHGSDYTINGIWQLNVPIKENYIQIFKDRASYFRGTIKNKSELKRIMKMIGI